MLIVDGDDKLLVVPVSLVPTWLTDSCFSATRLPSSTTSSPVAGLLSVYPFSWFFYIAADKIQVSHWVGHPNFEMVRHDVVEPFLIEVDRKSCIVFLPLKISLTPLAEIYHLACPASPPHYQINAVKTLKTSFEGTLNMLGLAKRTGARFLITSTSEVYGDPEEHPQREDYWGHVNCIGPRACYDEGKRVAETLTYGYHRKDGVEVRVARIFNTFGPRMNPYDGRVVSNFIIQALKGEDMTVYGDGSQTRSFQYVHDLIDGLILLMNGSDTRPVNIGNGDEFTILEFAEAVRVSYFSSSLNHTRLTTL